MLCVLWLHQNPYPKKGIPKKTFGFLWKNLQSREKGPSTFWSPTNDRFCLGSFFRAPPPPPPEKSKRTQPPQKPKNQQEPRQGPPDVELNLAPPGLATSLCYRNCTGSTKATAACGGRCSRKTRVKTPEEPRNSIRITHSSGRHFIFPSQTSFFHP